MIPLDRPEKWSSCLDERARQLLNPGEYRQYQSIPQSERLRQIEALLESPITCFSEVNDVFFRARWAEALDAVVPGPAPALLEVATGDADAIPQMLARTRPGSRYITANMNRNLTASLLAKTSGLPITMRVIEEDAARIDRHIAPQSIDVVAFQHAVNDVIQAILCDREGVDTIYSDWMETLPQMIQMMQRETAQHTLEQHAGPAFLGLLETLLGLLKKDGFMVMNHYMFQLDLDWGYPPEVWENIIPITRAWVKPLPSMQEVFIDGFDPHWWMFLQKK